LEYLNKLDKSNPNYLQELRRVAGDVFGSDMGEVLTSLILKSYETGIRDTKKAIVTKIID